MNYLVHIGKRLIEIIGGVGILKKLTGIISKLKKVKEEHEKEEPKEN